MARFRALFAASLSLVAAGSSVRGDATALPKGTSSCQDADITPAASLIRTIRPVGYPVVGFTAGIEGRLAKFHVEFGGAPGCRPPDEVHPLDDFSWNLGRPSGSTTTLEGEETLTPRFLLDVQGTYHIRLFPCPHGCTIQTVAGGPIEVPPQPMISLTITAVPSAPLAPESVPVLPPAALNPTAKHPLAQEHCSFDSGFSASQWFAVEQINSPDNYQLVEGIVESSRVSRKDSGFNHNFQDTNFKVRPDPPFNYLLRDFGPFNPSDPKIQAEIEVEWERNHFPTVKWPTQGDRVSAFGHWVYDCGHAAPFEIHPPVGVVVHRARPIQIPSNYPFDEFRGPDGLAQDVGSSVWVPGIISDMWFSKFGGKLMDCAVDSGLKNANFIGGQPTCVPPQSLDRVFKFNIYLPRNPRTTMLEAGIGVPPVPLYVETSNAPDSAARPPQIVQRTEDGITWLEVTVDLRGFAADHYEGRIIAGWVLPAADNWGLSSWKLRLHSLNVTNNGEGTDAAPATWRLWVNTNNTTTFPSFRAEWVNVLNGPVAIGVEDFDGLPWETDASNPTRYLGPNLLKYPAPEIPAIPGPRDPGILFNSTGYQDDPVTDDDAGTVNRLFRPAALAPQAFRNHCRPTSDLGGLLYSGCVDYTATIEILPVAPVGPASLSPGAQAVADRYVLRCETNRLGDPGECARILAPAAEVTATHPFEVPLAPGFGGIPFTAVGAFSAGEREVGLTEGSIEEFHEAVVRTRQIDPARVDRMLANLRAIIDESVAKDPTQKVSDFLAVVEASLPRDLWARHFGNFPRPPSDPDLPKANLTGAGVIDAAGRQIQISELRLHCARERVPNRLVVRWGSNRFDLDLVMSTACDGAAHEGIGVGRYNGVPGAVIRWRFVDGRGPAADAAAMTILVGSEKAAPVLEAAGPLLQGNLQAHER